MSDIETGIDDVCWIVYPESTSTEKSLPVRYIGWPYAVTNNQFNSVIISKEPVFEEPKIFDSKKIAEQFLENNTKGIIIDKGKAPKDYTDKEKLTISNSIRDIDYLEPINHMAYKKYSNAKFPGGVILALCCLQLFANIFIDGTARTFQENFGSVGILTLPIICIGLFYYLYNLRSTYHKRLHQVVEATKPLNDMGLNYMAPRDENDTARLWIMKTGICLPHEKYR